MVKGVYNLLKIGPTKIEDLTKYLVTFYMKKIKKKLTEGRHNIYIYTYYIVCTLPPTDPSLALYHSETLFPI